MQRKHAWRIFALIGLVALFLGRVYFANEKKERIERQQQTIEALSRQQLLERQQSPVVVDPDAEQRRKMLEQQQARLDSLRQKMEQDQKAFQERMNSLKKQK